MLKFPLDFPLKQNEDLLQEQIPLTYSERSKIREIEQDIGKYGNLEMTKENIIEKMKINFDLIKKGVSLNMSEAQYIFGRMHDDFCDVGLEKNEYEAVKYYQLSALQNNPKGQCTLGYCLNFGLGIEQDFKKAFENFKLSAEQNYPAGINNVGCLYRNGDGCEKSYELAFKYFSLALEFGYVKSLNNLAILYEKGLGVGINEKEAFRMYYLGAKKGDPEAKKNLNNMYMRGIKYDVFERED